MDANVSMDLTPFLSTMAQNAAYARVSLNNQIRIRAKLENRSEGELQDELQDELQEEYDQFVLNFAERFKDRFPDLREEYLQGKADRNKAA